MTTYRGPRPVNVDTEILSFIRCYGSSASSEADFDRLALKVFSHQYRRNRFYKRYCDMAGQTPVSVKTWKQIPAMPVAAFKDLLLTSFPAKKAVKIFRTSGTTRGSAQRGAHLFETLHLYKAAIVPLFKKILLSGKSSVDMRILTASPAEAPDSSLSFMMGFVRRRFGKSGKFYFRRGQPVFKELVRDLKGRRSSVVILATVFALKAFLDLLRRDNVRLKLPAGSRIMETGGFKGEMRDISKKALYGLCRQFFGIDEDLCFSEYGMTELSSQFYSRGSKGIFLGPAWVRTLVIDPSTGKEALKGKAGLLRHFDLANRGSVMAIQTEDIGRLRHGGFQVLGRATGAELRGCSLTYEEFVRDDR